MKAFIGDKEFLVESGAQGNSINGKPFRADIAEIKSGKFHVLLDHRSFSAEIIEVNKEEKAVTVKINQTIYHVIVKDQYDDLLQQLGLDNSNTRKSGDVKAPMPGLVINVMVKAGQKIKKGDAMLVLEAMKMENILKAAADGEVKKILVQKGDIVEKNQVMMLFE